VTDWVVVPGSLVSGNTISGAVSEFSFALVAPPPKPVLTNILRYWDVEAIYDNNYNGSTWSRIDENQEWGFGVIHNIYQGIFQDKILYPEDLSVTTTPELYSSEYGGTYWARTEAPGKINDTDPVGSFIELQTQYFYTKTEPDATLDFVVTGVLLEGISAIPELALDPCVGSAYECRSQNRASFNLSVVAWKTPDPKDISTWTSFYSADSFVYLIGAQGTWESDGNGLILANTEFNPDLHNDGGLHALVTLKSPVHFNIPLDKKSDDIKVGDKIAVFTFLFVKSVNTTQTEFYMGAYLRDPTTSPVSIITTGLDPAEAPPVLSAMPQFAVCGGDPDPAAGTLQFEKAESSASEHNEAYFYVTRTGGTQGIVSATATTTDGSAVAGTDYVATTQTVMFGDGDAEHKLVSVPIIGDTDIEPNETFTVTLSDPRGCTQIGMPSTDTVTIYDDDTPPVSYSVGGTVTGLQGSGLILRNNVVDDLPVAAAGPFTFSRKLLDKAAYTVIVQTQPSNPQQICTVTNGTGTINAGNVTNVQVTCADPIPQGSLDPAFNVTGKVSTTSVWSAKSIATQSDGSLVVLSDLNKLSRYNPDGTQDTNFGTAGVTTVNFIGASDIANAIAVNTDDTIIAVGQAGTGTSADFGVARFDKDGHLDTAFGNLGVKTIDINGSADAAKVVLIQGDKNIVVAGEGATATPLINTDFAVIRLTDLGDLDTSFDTDGKAWVNIAGNADLLTAAVIQSDNKIVVGGRVGIDGGANPDFAVVRFNSDGSLDTGFGANANGIVRLDLSGSGAADQVTGLAMQSDNKIVASLEIDIGGYKHGIERLDASGIPDINFGANGLVINSFATTGTDTAYAIAVDSTDRIITAGNTKPGGSSSFDFLVTRHLSDGSLDTTFANNGALITDFYATADGANCVLLQPLDGKIVAAGSALNGSINGLAMIRVLP